MQLCGFLTMNKFSSLLLTGLAFTFNAMADGISLSNKTATPLYMAVKKSPFDGYSANSQIGWISNGKTGVMRSNDTYLANMGIALNDSYILGFFNANMGTYTDCGEVISGTDRSFKYENGHCAEISQEAIRASSVFDAAILGCSGIHIDSYALSQINLHETQGIQNKQSFTMLRSLYPNADITLNGPINVYGTIKSGGEARLTGGVNVFDNIYRHFTDNLTKQDCDLLKFDKYLEQYAVSQDKSHLVTDKKMLNKLSYTATEFFSSSLKEKEITPTGETVDVYKVNNLDIDGNLNIKEGNVYIYIANNLRFGELGTISVSKNASLTLFVKGNVKWEGWFSTTRAFIDAPPPLSLYVGGTSVNIKTNKGIIHGGIYAPNADLKINSQEFGFIISGAIHANYFNFKGTTSIPSMFSYAEELSRLFKLNYTKNN